MYVQSRMTLVSCQLIACFRAVGTRTSLHLAEHVTMAVLTERAHCSALQATASQNCLSRTT